MRVSQENGIAIGADGSRKRRKTMAKNDYLARRDADRKGFFRAGEQTGRQVVLDMMVIVLRDP